MQGVIMLSLLQKKVTLKLFIAIFAIPLAVVSFVSSYQHDLLLFALISNFKFQYFAISLVLLFLAFFTKSKLFISFIFLLTIYNACFICPWYFSPDQSTEEPLFKLKLLHANVFTDNSNKNALIKLIQQEDPDIITVQEIDEWWRNSLEVIYTDYPYYQTIPREDNFGIGIYSKYPFKELNVRANMIYTPTLAIELSIKNHPFIVMTTHPVPPVNQAYFMRRNRQLEYLAKWCQKSTKPLVVIGDMNLTLWSDHYKSFIETSNLQNSRQGFGMIGSWPTNMLLMRIPIDQCFNSKEFTVSDIRVADSIDSDHLPLIVDLEFNPKTTVKNNKISLLNN